MSHCSFELVNGTYLMSASLQMVLEGSWIPHVFSTQVAVEHVVRNIGVGRNLALVILSGCGFILAGSSIPKWIHLFFHKKNIEIRIPAEIKMIQQKCQVGSSMNDSNELTCSSGCNNWTVLLMDFPIPLTSSRESLIEPRSAKATAKFPRKWKS